MTIKGFGSLLDESFTLYKEHFSLFLRVSFLIYFIPTVIIGLLSFRMPNPWMQRLFELIRLLMYVLVTMLLTFTVIRILLAKRTKSEISTKGAIVEGGRHFLKGTLLTIVMGLGLIGLFLLFIVPGVAYSVYWAFAYYSLITDNKGIIEALHHSRKVVEGKWWNVAGYLYVLSIMLLGIIVSFVLPLSYAGLSLAYYSRDILVWTATQWLVFFSIIIIQMTLLPFVLVFMERYYLSLKEKH